MSFSNERVSFWQGKTVRLRALEPADAEFFFHLQQDTERSRLLDFLHPPRSRTALEAWAKEMAHRELQGDAYQWLVETLAGEPVGSIATHTCDGRNGTFSYALDIAHEYRRQGYAAEAITLVLRYYFGELRYQKANVDTRSDNVATIRLHEKLGFTREGLRRRMVFQQGRYFDLALFGLTQEEFEAAR